MNKTMRKTIAIIMAALMFLGTFSACFFIVASMLKTTKSFPDIVELASDDLNVQAWYKDSSELYPSDELTDILNLSLRKYKKDTENLVLKEEIIFYNADTKEEIPISIYEDGIYQINSVFYQSV